MATTEKIEFVGSLSRTMSSANAIYLADFTGVDVESVTQLRRSLREAGIEYRVVKNRLAKLAAADAGLEILNEFLAGPTAMAFSPEDPVAPAKILQKFIDDGGSLVIQLGLVDGQVLTPEAVLQLAKLPGKEELLGKLLGSVQSPLYGFAGVLNGLLRNLVGVISAIEQKNTSGDPDGE